MKERNIIFSILAFLLSIFLFFSCSNVSDDNNGEKGSISINFGNERIIENYTIKDLSYYIVSIQPKVQNDIKVAKNSVAQFSELDSGTYTITVKAYNDKDEVIAIGANSVTVKEGQDSTVAIMMKAGTYDKPLSTPIVLWNNSTSESQVVSTTSGNPRILSGLTIGFQLFDSVSANQRITSPVYPNKKLQDFCFDAETGDFYACLKTDQTIIIKKPADGSQIETYNNIENINDSSKIAFFNKKLYFPTSSSFYSCDLSSESKVVTEISQLSEVGVNVIYADAKYFYIIDDSSNLHIYDTNFKEVMSTSSLGINIDCNTITDLTTIGNDIYVIAKDNSEVKGAVYKYSINETSVLPTTFNNGEHEFGNATISLPTAEPASSVVSNKFYGPSKFIAIRPKELVIAEEAGYADFNDQNTCKSINKVTTINLETMSMTQVDVDVTFDKGYREGLTSYDNY